MKLKKRGVLCCVLLAAVQCFVGRLFADELGDKLRSVDNLRAGFETRFDEVDRRCQALLAQYSKPEEQGRIYLAWVQVEGQSGIQNPAKQVTLVQKALSLPQEPEDRLQLHMYWGNALERASFGITDGELSSLRAEIVVHYLRAIELGLGYIKDVQAASLPEHFPVEGDDLSNLRASINRKSAELRKKRKVERFQESQDAFIAQTAAIYSRRPFEMAQLDKLASQYISEKKVRERLMKRVTSEIDNSRRK